MEERALEMPRPARDHHTRVPTSSGVPALGVGRKEGVTACSRLEPSLPITCDDRTPDKGRVQRVWRYPGAPV